MSIIALAWKNLKSKPLAMLLSLVLFALGTGLIALLLQLQHQLQNNFERNLAGIDLVVGAKGSPLQLILSSMYHVDAPTGNISLKEARPFLNPNHPLIGTAVPLSMGDSYRGFRIVGTNKALLDLYQPEIQEGRFWEANMEVTIGALVAKTTGLKIGNEFKSSHGFEDGIDLGHVDHLSFEVVGILAPQGTVVDQLILTTNQSYWYVHGEMGHDHDHDHEHGHHSDDHNGHHSHEHDHHDHGDDHDHDHGHTHTHDHNNGHTHAHDHDSERPLQDTPHNDDHGHADTGSTHMHAEEEHRSVPGDLREEPDTLSITSLLIKFRARNYQALNMQRNINENTDMQAATPAIEINRLYNLMSSGEQVLRALAWVIIIVSGLSIFISLFSSLRDRRYELALMRVMGAGRTKLFTLIIVEGLLLAGIGCLAGILLSHVAMEFAGRAMQEAYRYAFTGWQFLKEELWLIAGALLIGLLAAVIPAISASRTDIANTLTEG